jgi:hypothetical protein
VRLSLASMFVNLASTRGFAHRRWRAHSCANASKDILLANYEEGGPVQRSLKLLWMVGALWALPALASAQERGPRLHLGAGLALDFGGELEVEDSVDTDLEATIGVRGHADYAVHRHVSVGGLVRLSWWEPDYARYGYDRSLLFDIGPRVIGHFDYRDFRFYSGLSLGLSLSAIDNDFTEFDNPAFGPTLTLTVAGFEWWFARSTGLFAELGWVGHWFEQEIDGTDREVEFGLSQGLFEFGLVFGV